MDFKTQMAAIRAEQQKKHEQYTRQKEEDEAREQRNHEIVKQVINQWLWVYRENKKTSEQKAGERIVRWIRRLPQYTTYFENAEDILLGNIRKGLNFIRIPSDLGLYGFDLREIGPQIKSICPYRSDAGAYAQQITEIFPNLIRSIEGTGLGDMTWKNVDDILCQWGRVDPDIRGDILAEEVRYRKAECKDMEKLGMFTY